MPKKEEHSDEKAYLHPENGSDTVGSRDQGVTSTKVIRLTYKFTFVYILRKANGEVIQAGSFFLWR